ncbi:hypothetical protein JAAARDRAFT_596663 [Jaapia argillacea MUCL 33604]|uniref:F-box domain-containing protein n=1 Tax=Jaapia argillacea MUCL 33604 TaxID=933084 RepID=A0A067PZJ3_9AGAM|nr:hypothetical protein JAAARDRAFT_596663 [Jaapia argillacea MUCL 33604]
MMSIYSIPSFHVRRHLVSDIDGRIARLALLEEEVASLRRSIEDDLVSIALHRTLPPEILGEIFSLAVDKDTWRFPITISQVCRQWRTIVHQYPRAWTLIRINRRSTLRLLRFWLGKSGVCPLTIEFDGTAVGCVEYEELVWPLINALVPHSSRIRSLTMAAHAHLIETFLAKCSLDFRNLEEFNLKDYTWCRADVGHRSYDHSSAFQLAPRLLTASFYGCIPDISPDTPFTFTPLTKLHLGFVRTSYPRLRQLLQSCTMLELLELRVECLLQPSSRGDEEVATLDHLQTLIVRSSQQRFEKRCFNGVHPLAIIRAPNLSSIGLYDCSPVVEGRSLAEFVTNLMIRSDRPPVRRLALCASDWDGDSMSSCLDAMPLLEDLSFEDSVVDDECLQVLSSPSLSPRLQILTLRRCHQVSGESLRSTMENRLSQLAHKNQFLSTLTVERCGGISPSHAKALQDAAMPDRVQLRVLYSPLLEASTPVVS